MSVCINLIVASKARVKLFFYNNFNKNDDIFPIFNLILSKNLCLNLDLAEHLKILLTKVSFNLHVTVCTYPA